MSKKINLYKFIPVLFSFLIFIYLITYFFHFLKCDQGEYCTLEFIFLFMSFLIYNIPIIIGFILSLININKKKNYLIVIELILSCLKLIIFKLFENSNVFYNITILKIIIYILILLIILLCLYKIIFNICNKIR